ncbi:MAG: FKBP-type peptidyl-prolyl cis-trans isomerase, partial [marine benthic group bacterium]|nr:FKBP-type peptidyl-prolyl cis-trans isomerase [Candidatus Benthicola marisminoris]
GWIALMLVGCAQSADESARPPDDAPPPAEAPAETQDPARAPADVEFAPELAVDLDAMTLSETGLYVQVLEEGDGPQAVPGDQLGVHYTVWLSDGSKLDSSFDKTPPAPYDLILGRTPLIAGWNEGVTGMRLGEKRRLVVPYQLGYRAEGRPPAIPGYSTLVFEVELAAHEPAAAE